MHAACQPGCFLLLAQLADCRLHARGGLFAHPAAPVDDAIDGRRAETGLKGDILDEEVMRHVAVPSKSDGFLMDIISRGHRNRRL